MQAKIIGLLLSLLLIFPSFSSIDAYDLNLFQYDDMSFENFEILKITKNSDQKVSTDRSSLSYKISLAENLDVITNKKRSSEQVISTPIFERKLNMIEKIDVATGQYGKDSIILTVKHNADRQAMMERILYKERSKGQDSGLLASLANQLVDSNHDDNLIDANNIWSTISVPFNENFIELLDDQIHFLTISNIDQSFFDWRYLDNLWNVDPNNPIFNAFENSVSTVVDTKNPVLLLLLIPLVGFVFIRNENSDVKFYHLQKFLSLLFIGILLSSAIITPYSISSSYWPEAYAEEMDTDNSTDSDVSTIDSGEIPSITDFTEVLDDLPLDSTTQEEPSTGDTIPNVVP
ncbi:hypothetical protein C6988_02930, partial [Nitrosopumilus sp. b1]|uniref:hypothetical protein n=1 Tax=Nitrosopumilus sp. b1 TaxID=2109907 RepID=UPI0015F3F05E